MAFSSEAVPIRCEIDGQRRVMKYLRATEFRGGTYEIGMAGGRCDRRPFDRGPASAQGVKIGILNDQSGVYADYGGKYSVEAAKMAIEDFGGEVLGQKIEMVTADHQNKPDLAVSIARRWYDTENVDMITELTTSSVALAVQELSKEKKKIDIVVGAATSRITGDACTPYGFHWAFDTHALAVGTGGALVKAGGDSWFFLTADYAFGYALEKDTSDIVKANGGKVLGSVRIPLNSSDFSSFLLQAQSSKAKIIGLANAGLDTTNSIKQAAEFGIVKGGQKLAGLLMTLAEVNGLGLRGGAGPGADRGLLLGSRRQDRAPSASASSSAPAGCRT